MQTVQEDAGDYNCAAVTTYTMGSRPAPSIAPLTSSVTITGILPVTIMSS